MRCFWRQWNTSMTGESAIPEGSPYDTSYLERPAAKPVLETSSSGMTQ
jgi:hypothetical protein